MRSRWLSIWCVANRGDTRLWRAEGGTKVPLLRADVWLPTS